MDIKEIQSVQRTDEETCFTPTFSFVRFTDFVASSPDPSDKSLGYFQPSAMRGLNGVVPSWVRSFCCYLRPMNSVSILGTGDVTTRVL
jgi:hypothetical protein